MLISSRQMYDWQQLEIRIRKKDGTKNNYNCSTNV